jgi:hypothetical protein
MWDHTNLPVHSYAPGSISITALGSGVVDLGRVGRTVSGSKFMGFNDGDRTGFTGTGIGDIDGDGVNDFVIVNRYGKPLSASGVRFKLAAYVEAASRTTPSLRSKHVTPHSFRHATAVHLVSAGVDITIIRSWLGHVSLDTTNHYAQANLETKRKALERVGAPGSAGKPPSWKRDASVLAWLDTL